MSSQELKELSVYQRARLDARVREVFETISAGDFDPLVEYHLKCRLRPEEWLLYLQVLQVRQEPHCEKCGQAIKK